MKDRQILQKIERALGVGWFARWNRYRANSLRQKESLREFSRIRPADPEKSDRGGNVKRQRDITRLSIPSLSRRFLELEVSLEKRKRGFNR